VFFDQWVYGRGFPHFSVLGFHAKPEGDKYITSVNIGQRLRFAPEFFEDVPMDVTFYSSDFQSQTINVELSKERQNMILETDFIPVYCALDMHKKISDAITDDYKWVKDTGMYNFGDAMMVIQVNKSADSSLVRVEHNWVGADNYFSKGLPFVSRERYWTVDGVWNNNFNADATIEYFGRETGINYAAGYLDVDLIRNTEENLVLVYRPNSSADWAICQDYSWEMGSKFDKRGSFTIHNLKKGQYAFGVNESDRLSVKADLTLSEKYISVNPNPTKDSLNITVQDAEGKVVEITDGSGRLVMQFTAKKYSETTYINVSEWSKGMYYVGIVVNDRPYQPKRVLIR
jgi:hypothetical protein